MMLPSFLVPLAAAASLVSGSAIPSIPDRDVSAIPARDVSVIPAQVSQVERRGSHSGTVYKLSELRRRGMLEPLSDLQRRDDGNKTIDLSWQLEEVPLYSAKWSGEIPRVPVAGIPGLEAGATGNIEMTIQCVDCRTYGTITASLEEPKDDNDSHYAVQAGFTFNNAGVYLDMSMFVSGEGTYTIGLGTVQKTPPVQAGTLHFSANIGAALDLIIQVTGEVKATGGLMVTIPDGEFLGLDIDANFFDDGQLVNIDGSMDLVPDAEFRLLPLAITDASANITAAVKLHAEAGLKATANLAVGKVNFEAGAGAEFVLARAKLGATYNLASEDCRRAVHCDVDITAGAYVEGAIGFNDHNFTKKADAATVFMTAGVTLCYPASDPTPTPAFIATKAAPQPVAQAIEDGNCPSAVTATTTISSEYSIVTCAVPEIDCPDRFRQTVMVTNSEVVTTTTCPGLSGAATATARAVVAPAEPRGDIISFTQLAVKETKFANAYANITAAATQATITGAFVSATPPPPPPEPTDLNTPNDSSQSDDDDSAGAALAPRASMGALLAVAAAMLLL